MSVLIAIIGAAGSACAQGLPPLHKLEPEIRAERLAADLQTVLAWRGILRGALGYAAAHPELFPGRSPDDDSPPTPQRLRAAHELWAAFADARMGLDSLGRYYAGFHRLHGAEREDCLLVAAAAFLAGWRGTLELVDLAQRAGLGPVFDEAVPELGLAAGSYSKTRERALSADPTSESRALAAILRAADATAPPAAAAWSAAAPADLSPAGVEGADPGNLSSSAAIIGSRKPAVRDAVAEDLQAAWKGRVAARPMGEREAWRTLGRFGITDWLPVEPGVSATSVGTQSRGLIGSLLDAEPAASLPTRLEPGDILLVRHPESMPEAGGGFWHHAALYIGTEAERIHYFGGDRETKDWVESQNVGDGNLETLLDLKDQKAYERSRLGRDGGPARVIEADDGIVGYSSLEHAARGDSLAVLRPRLSKRLKASAILQAMALVDRPEDPASDLADERSIGCGELVARAYAPSEGTRGLPVPAVESLGRKVVPANTYARWFDAIYDAPDRAVDLVVFLDGYGDRGRAFETGPEAFRKSWKRAKWQVDLP